MDNHGGAHLGLLMEHPGVEDQAERAMTAVGSLVLQLRREAGYSIGSLARPPGSAPACSARSSAARATPR